MSEIIDFQRFRFGLYVLFGRHGSVASRSWFGLVSSLPPKIRFGSIVEKKNFFICSIKVLYTPKSMVPSLKK